MALLTVFIMTAQAALSPGGEGDGGEGGDTASAQPIDIAPSLMEIELVTLSESTIAVSWVTDVETDSWLEYGETADYGMREEDDTHTRFHLVEVDGLQPDTLYHYKVGSSIVEGPDEKIRTLPLPGGDYIFSFAVAGDTHYSTGLADTAGRMRSESHDIAVAMVDELDSRPELEFAVLVGDLADSGAPEEFQGLAGVLDDLDLAVHNLPGNHDKGQSDGTEGMELLGGEGWEVGGYMHGLREYYGRTMVGLDSATYPYETPGWIPQDQLEMLEEAMSPSAGSAQPSFAFLHHPGEMHAEDSEQFDTLENRDQLQSALVNATEAGGMPLGVFSGHTHRNAVRFAENTSMLPYFTCAAIVEYPIGYSVINVYRDGYTVHFRKVFGALEQSESSRQRQRVSSPNSDLKKLGTLADRSLSVTALGGGEFDITFGVEEGGTGPAPPTPGQGQGGPTVHSVRADPPSIDLEDPDPVIITAQVSDPDGVDDIAVVSADIDLLRPGLENPVLYLNDDGEDGDSTAGDGTFTLRVDNPAPAGTGEISIVVTAVDATGLTDEGNATVRVTEEVYTGGDDGGDEGSDESTPGFDVALVLLASIIAAVAAVSLMGRRRGGGGRGSGRGRGGEKGGVGEGHRAPRRMGGCVRHRLCYRGGS